MNALLNMVTKILKNVMNPLIFYGSSVIDIVVQAFISEVYR